MFGGGTGMGGGSGGGMLRVVGRLVARAGVAAGNSTTFQEPLSASKSGTASHTSASRANASQKLNSTNDNTNNLSISSGSFPANSLPVYVNSGVPCSGPAFVASPTSASSCCDELFEWDGFAENEKPVGFLDEFVLGSVPSVDEVQNAVSALQQVFDPSTCSQLVSDKYPYSLGKDRGDCISITPELIHGVSSGGSELDWMEPSLHLLNSRTLESHGTLQSHGSNRVFDAFHLLQTEPSVQRMVVSLSSDKAVWDAVFNNEVVRELRASYSAGEGSSTPHSSVASSDDTNEAMNIVKWIFDSTRAKIMEVFETITRIVNELFGPSPKNKATTAGATDPFEEKLRTSFLLSVVVLLIVVLTRAHGA